LSSQNSISAKIPLKIEDKEYSQSTNTNSIVCQQICTTEMLHKALQVDGGEKSIVCKLRFTEKNREHWKRLTCEYLAFRVSRINYLKTPNNLKQKLHYCIMRYGVYNMYTCEIYDNKAQV
jgi:hypothetical protein